MRRSFLLGLILSLIFIASNCSDDEKDEAAPTSSITLRSSYPGADDCSNSSCHTTIGNVWKQSGHAYKMNEIDSTNPSIPIYPFSDISAMFPTGGHEIVFGDFTDSTVKDTTSMSLTNTFYVIGGYGWKGRYVDNTGYIRHGSNAQYNLATGTWSAYHDKTSNVDDDDVVEVSYSCGFCHTTGWTTPRTDAGLANMTGNITYAAITCQRCHGTDTNGVEGQIHNTKFMKANTYSASEGLVDGNDARIEAAADSSYKVNNVCADCHIRGDKINEVPVKKGLIRHHEQSQELYAGRHGQTDETTAGNNIGCMDCHDPHASTKYDSKADGEGVESTVSSNGDCSVSACHGSKNIAATYSANHTCVDCHMPRIVKSALSFPAAGNVKADGTTYAGATPVTGVTTLGIPGGKRGDIRSHIFALSASEDATFLDASVLTDATAQVKIPVDFSCMTCHGTGGKGPIDAAAAVTQLIDIAVH